MPSGWSASMPEHEECVGAWARSRIAGGLGNLGKRKADQPVAQSREMKGTESRANESRASRVKKRVGSISSASASLLVSPVRCRPTGEG